MRPAAHRLLDSSTACLQQSAVNLPLACLAGDGARTGALGPCTLVVVVEYKHRQHGARKAVGTTHTNMRGGVVMLMLWATIAFVAVYCAYFSLAVARPRAAPLPDVAQLIARSTSRRRMATASASAPPPPPPHAAANATAAAAAATTAHEAEPSRLLTQADVLRRVPEGGVAFFTLAIA